MYQPPDVDAAAYPEDGGGRGPRGTITRRALRARHSGICALSITYQCHSHNWGHLGGPVCAWVGLELR